MRRAFEIAAGKYPNRLPLDVGADGHYLDTRTNVAWLLWQDARAPAQEPAQPAQDDAVAELVDVLKTVVAVSGLASIAIAKHGTDGGQSNG